MSKTEKIYLITKADDAGSNGSANRAFLDGFKQGILRNGVIRMTCNWARQAADMFKDEKGFCVGLHLTMNAEWDTVKWGPVMPSSKVPSLVDQHGCFFQTTKKLKENNPSKTELFAEMQAQLDLARKFGLNIQFVDTHMVFNWVVDDFEEEFQKWRQRNGIVLSTGDFQPLPETKADGDPVDRLIARLKAAKPGVYSIHMGHPAYDTAEMRGLGHPGYDGDTVAEEREWDRKTLMDPRIVDYCRNNAVVPVTLEEAYHLGC